MLMQSVTLVFLLSSLIMVTSASILRPNWPPAVTAAGVNCRINGKVSSNSNLASFSTLSWVVTSVGPPGVKVTVPATSLP